MYDDLTYCPSCQTLSAGEAILVQDAIDNLINHPIRECQMAGSDLQVKMDAGDIGLDPYTSDYGYMSPGDPWIALGQSSFSDPHELQNTLAHEQSHMRGYEDRGGWGTGGYYGDGGWSSMGMGNAYEFGSMCGGR
jgi:hypothetical protein